MTDKVLFDLLGANCVFAVPAYSSEDVSQNTLLCFSPAQL